MHLGDDAESYALGLLPLADRPRIEAHLTACDLCRKRVVDAEETAWRLSSTLAAIAAPRRRRTMRSPIAWAAGLAAAFALAFGVQSVRLVQADTAIDGTAHALSIVAASHFDHLTMTPVGGTLVAKVLYAKDRSWLYCIVDSPIAYTVVGMHAGVARALGTTAPDGAVSTAFIAAGPVDTVELRTGSTLVARVFLR
jgi:anti-sigma factor RsiW